MTPAQIVRQLRGSADAAETEAGKHGTATVTVWQLRRAADAIEQLAARVAELEHVEPSTLFDEAEPC